MPYSFAPFFHLVLFSQIKAMLIKSDLGSTLFFESIGHFF